MTTKKAATARSRTGRAPSRPSSPYQRLQTLLHTMRCIAQYEDSLCELSHEVKHTGRLSEEVRVALEGILEKIPSREYVHELDDLALLLASPDQPTSSARKRKSATKSR